MLSNADKGINGLEVRHVLQMVVLNVVKCFLPING